MLQRRGHLAENYLLDSLDPPIATRVLAHISAHTGVDIPSLTTPASGSDAPPAIHHARLLAARLMRRTALASWPAVAAVIAGHPDNIGHPLACSRLSSCEGRDRFRPQRALRGCR